MPNGGRVYIEVSALRKIYTLALAKNKMAQVVLEPTTTRSGVERSSSELPSHVICSDACHGYVYMIKILGSPVAESNHHLWSYSPSLCH